ncbi:MAG: ABC transporter permease [Thermonemataceae bacterium]
MNVYRLIAKRLAAPSDTSIFSATVSKVAMANIAIGIILLTIAFAVLGGFKQEVKRRIFSFSGHIQVTKYSNNLSYEETPINTDRKLYKSYKNYPYIDHLQVYGQKAGVIKANENVLGVIVKGIGKDYRAADFTPNLEEGRLVKIPASGYAKEVVISRTIADRLNLQLKDSLLVFFIQDPPRFRKLKVVGIYATGMEGFDEKFVLGDIGLIQRLNSWGDTLVSGYEIFLKDFNQLQEKSEALDEELDFDMSQELITRKHIDIFDWLILLDQNVVAFLTIILLVACFNMVAVLVIMMMERIQMIGILKALGASNRQIQRIFIERGLRIVLKGIFWGNLIGWGVCALQYFFHIIPLDPKNYYMNTVPIAWNWQDLLLMNLGFFTLVMGVIIIPTIIIANIKPIKAIKFS